jgi:hypothetical protein
MKTDINPVLNRSNAIITGTVALVAVLLLIGFIFG